MKIATRRWPALTACAFALATVAGATATQDVAGTAARVENGDTFVLRVGGDEVEVRLADIGAPQGSQYYAPSARGLLEAMLADRGLSVRVSGRRDTRHVFGHVHAGDLDVNLELVRRGAAWVCWEYALDTDYMPFENDARIKRRGLWAATWDIDARVACRNRPPALEPLHPR